MAIENLLKALLESQAFIFGPSNKAAAMAMLKRYLRINDQQAEEGYKDVINGLDRTKVSRARLGRLAKEGYQKMAREDAADAEAYLLWNPRHGTERCK